MTGHDIHNRGLKCQARCSETSGHGGISYGFPVSGIPSSHQFHTSQGDEQGELCIGMRVTILLFGSGLVMPSIARNMSPKRILVHKS